MSAINAYVLSMQENGIDVMPQSNEPNNIKSDLDTGIWFKSLNGGWYRDKDEAGDIAGVRIDGKHYVEKEFDAAFTEWWQSLDSDMQSNKKPF